LYRCSRCTAPATCLIAHGFKRTVRAELGLTEGLELLAFFLLEHISTGTRIVGQLNLDVSIEPTGVLLAIALLGTEATRLVALPRAHGRTFARVAERSVTHVT
jgi:hypothetical protein